MHLQALCDERGTTLLQTNLQLAALTEKAQLLTAVLSHAVQQAACWCAELCYTAGCFLHC
jgi:hypothetical protein